jgi:quercetin dioxygenase-like cupin family protein
MQDLLEQAPGSRLGGSVAYRFGETFRVLQLDRASTSAKRKCGRRRGCAHCSGDEHMDTRSTPNTTVIKIDSSHSPRGPGGQKYLASGVRVSMRLWEENVDAPIVETKRDYEVVGYVLRGRAELHVEGQMVLLSSGDSYVVPRDARHHYKILERFSAVEATSPPAQVHGREETSGRSRGAAT